MGFPAKFRSSLLLLTLFPGVPLLGQNAVSNSKTGLFYPTLQASVNAATNQFTNYVCMDLLNFSVSISNKTNMVITTGPTYSGRALIQGGGGTNIGFNITHSPGIEISTLRIAFLAGSASIRQTSSGGIFTNLILSNNQGRGIWLDGSDANSNLIAGNLIRSNLTGAGIAIEGGRFNTVRSCTISNGTNGIELHGGSSNLIQSNKLTDNTLYGILLDSGCSNHLVSNFISMTGPTAGSAGIWVVDGTNETVTMNQSTSNVSGIVVSGRADRCLVTRNTVTFNTNFGIQISGTGHLVGTNTILGQNGLGDGIYATIATNCQIQSNHIFSNNNALRTLNAWSNRLENNLVHDSTNGFLGGAGTVDCTLASNDLVTNKGGILFQGATATRNSLIAENRISGFGGGNVGIAQYGGSGMSNRYHGNVLMGWNHGFNFTGVTGVVIAGSTVQSNGYNGIMMTGSTNISILSNRIDAMTQAAGNGLNLSNQCANLVVQSNEISGAPCGMILAGSDQSLVARNIVGGSTRVGISNTTGSGNTIELNSLTNCAISLWADGTLWKARSNHLGGRSTGEWTVSPGLPVSPWLPQPIGRNGDFEPPPFPTNVTGSLLPNSQVILSWEPESTAPDFACYAIWRITNSTDGWSNISDSDLVSVESNAGTLQFVDTPPLGFNYLYFVTVRDTNGNESIYSPSVEVSSEYPTVSVYPPSISTNVPLEITLNAEQSSGFWSTNGGMTWFSFPEGTLVLPVSNTVELLIYGQGAFSRTATNRYTYTLDLVPPTVTVTPGSDLVTNSWIPATFSVDERNGYWSTNGGTNWFRFGTEGSNARFYRSATLLYFGLDAAGNSSPTNQLQWVVHDTTQPVMGISHPSMLTNAPFIATLTVDEPIGFWSTNGGFTWTPFSDWTTTIPIQGPTTLLYFAVDASGNTCATNQVTYQFVPRVTVFRVVPHAGSDRLLFETQVTSGGALTYDLRYQYKNSTGNFWSAGGGWQSGSANQWISVPDGRFLTPATALSPLVFTNRLDRRHVETKGWVDFRVILRCQGQDFGETVATGVDLSVFGDAQGSPVSGCLLNNPWRGEPEGILIMNIPENSRAQIHTVSGKLVADLPNADGRGRTQWNVRDRQGRPVPRGAYVLRVVHGTDEKNFPILVVP